MFFKGSKKGILLFEEAHGVGGLSEWAVVRPADFGRPDHRRVFRPRTTEEPHHRFIPMSYTLEQDQ